MNLVQPVVRHRSEKFAEAIFRQRHFVHIFWLLTLLRICGDRGSRLRRWRRGSWRGGWRRPGFLRRARCAWALRRIALVERIAELFFVERGIRRFHGIGVWCQRLRREVRNRSFEIAEIIQRARRWAFAGFRERRGQSIGSRVVAAAVGGDPAKLAHQLRKRLRPLPSRSSQTNSFAKSARSSSQPGRVSVFVATRIAR